VAQIVQLPVSLEFRTPQIQWEQAFAHVIGWWKNKDGMEDFVQLVAEGESNGVKSSFKFPVSTLSAEERKLCLATVGKQHSDEAVKEICSGLELPYFTHSHRTYIEDSEMVMNSQPADPWLMREEFLRLKPESRTAMAFLTKWGRWRPFRSLVDLAEMIRLQRAVREALVSPSDKWFASVYANPMMRLSCSYRHPSYFTMLTDACAVAIRMTTTMDLWRQLKFATCARRDCGRPFQVKSDHKRNYCSQYCGHLESVRRNRKTKTKGDG